MLQTRIDEKEDIITGDSFKSPRECYKLFLSLCLYIEMFMFQVPKGMLQTFSLSFAQGDNVAFQVPKGMLQTLLTIILL